MESKAIRPTKKQHELLSFIESFIAEKGYGPSYREIMAGCNYSSVATVALHINNLISKGFLRKKNRSARSLEVVNQTALADPQIKTNLVKPNDEKWLVEHIEYRVKQAENSPPDKAELDNLFVLVGALKALGLEGAANSFTPRLSSLKQRYQ